MVQVSVLETDTFEWFYKIQSSECHKVHCKIAILILNSVSFRIFPSSDYFENNTNFQEFSLKWTSTVTRNTIFLQSKPYLQKFFVRQSEMDDNGEWVSVTLSWYQYITFAVVYLPLAIYLIWSTVPTSITSHSQVSKHFFQ